jgi:glycosyltransferase involved in cell wall biosynthesis
MRRPDRDDAPSPTALVLVRNTVTRDARVLRESAVLRDLGFRVLIAGVVSPAERETELELEGFPIVRLPLLEPLKALLRRRGAAAGREAPTTSTGRRRGPATTSGLGFHIRRLAVTLAYYVQGVALVLRTSPKLVHANDYNTMWIGVAAKALRGSRLVYDAHELWPDRNNRPEWRPWLVACEWLFLRIADVTLTVSPGCATVIAGRYRVPPPTVVRNIPDRNVPAHPRPEAAQAGDGRLAVYVGAIAPGRGIEQALEALAVAGEFRLRLVGSSDGFEGRFEELAQTAGVSGQVEFRGLVSPSAVGAEIADAAMGLALIQPVCLSYEQSLPNKLFEYAAAGLPVLASDLPVLGTLVREEGIGEAVPPSDVESIVQAMRRLADPERNAAVRERVRSFAERVTWLEERRLLENAYSSLLRPATAAS